MPCHHGKDLDATRQTETVRRMTNAAVKWTVNPMQAVVVVSLLRTKMAKTSKVEEMVTALILLAVSNLESK